ncbi:uncharacterized protein LOC143300266 [Babylonia areolata]|uniref:uncharacterized protein LOC143300266 n=1 Tax=Babylonia areolata TaxID=304850 RepID=UPI003FD465FA
MFEGRDTGYVIGSVLILTATAVSVVGIISPGWLQFESPTAKNVTSAGLFLQCSRFHASCRPVELLEIKGFEMWSHVIISLGVVALFVSSVFIVVLNCSTTATERRLKVVEGFGVYGGFFIFIGIINYVANEPKKWRSSYGYAFFLTLLSSLLATTGGVLVALHNRKPRDPPHVQSDVEENVGGEAAAAEAAASTAGFEEVVVVLGS